MITPAPVSITYPTLLGHAGAELLAYSRETVIAEKLEAMVSLGRLNSRLKDFFDLWLLARTQKFDGTVLAEAISRTFAQRQTQVNARPVCFTDEFANDPAKAAQWAAFVRNARLVSAAPVAFSEVVTTVADFLRPILQGIIGGLG